MRGSCTAAVLAAHSRTGCAASTPTPAAATKNIDDSVAPTANHLHNIAGMMLLYFASRYDLPAKLEEIEGIRDPVSVRPYVHTLRASQPDGLPMKPLIYQAKPITLGGRWAILVNDVATDKHLITYDERVPESVLAVHRSSKAP